MNERGDESNDALRQELIVSLFLSLSLSLFRLTLLGDLNISIVSAPSRVSLTHSSSSSSSFARTRNGFIHFPIAGTTTGGCDFARTRRRTARPRRYDPFSERDSVSVLSVPDNFARIVTRMTCGGVARRCRVRFTAFRGGNDPRGDPSPNRADGRRLIARLASSPTNNFPRRRRRAPNAR